MSIVRLERRKMVGIGKRPQPAQTRVVHARTSAGTLPGNQRRPNQKATFTSRISTGTSTSGPMTAAKATGEASAKAAMATAMVSSKLLTAAVNATAVVRGESQIGSASCRGRVGKKVRKWGEAVT